MGFSMARWQPTCCFRVEGFGVFWGLGFGVWGLGVWGFGVWGLEIWGFGV